MQCSHAGIHPAVFVMLSKADIPAQRECRQGANYDRLGAHFSRRRRQRCCWRRPMRSCCPATRRPQPANLRGALSSAAATPILAPTVSCWPVPLDLSSAMECFVSHFKNILSATTPLQCSLSIVQNAKAWCSSKSSSSCGGGEGAGGCGAGPGGTQLRNGGGHLMSANTCTRAPKPDPDVQANLRTWCCEESSRGPISATRSAAATL